MNKKIIRTKKIAQGGITEDENVRLKEHADLWIKRILRTEPIDKDKITEAIKGIYRVSNLKEPRVVIVQSPFVASIAGGLASSVWYLRKNGNKKLYTRAATHDATDAATHDATDAATHAATSAATYAATRAATYDATDAATHDATYAATRDATRAATDDATYDATDAATRAATYAATRDATFSATYAATDDATHAATDDATRDATDAKQNWLLSLVKKITPNAIEFSLSCIRLSYNMRQGGNFWGQWDSCYTAFRDVLGLELPVYDKYKYWEQAAIEGNYRIMHDEFCIVSDFPEKISRNMQNQPHCETGPALRWRDGFEIYALHGIRFEKDLYWKIINKSLTFSEVQKIEDIDKKAIAYKYIPATQFLKEAKAELINGKTDRGNELWKIPKGNVDVFDQDEYLLHYFCPSSGREYLEAVDPERAKRENYNADACMAARHHFLLSEYLDKSFISV